MDKHTFFNKLHEELARIHNTNISGIGFIRSRILGDKLKKEEVLKLTRSLLSKLRTQPTPSLYKIEKYQSVIKLITRSSDIIWEDIIQKTGYDR